MPILTLAMLIQWVLAWKQRVRILSLILLVCCTVGCRSREEIVADLLPNYRPKNWAVVQVNGNWGTRFAGSGNLPIINQ